MRDRCTLSLPLCCCGALDAISSLYHCCLVVILLWVFSNEVLEGFSLLWGEGALLECLPKEVDPRATPPTGVAACWSGSLASGIFVCSGGWRAPKWLQSYYWRIHTSSSRTASTWWPGDCVIDYWLNCLINILIYDFFSWVPSQTHLNASILMCRLLCVCDGTQEKKSYINIFMRQFNQ